MKTKVAVLLICTGKYIDFLEPHLTSSRKYLLTNESQFEKHYYIFTNHRPKGIPPPNTTFIFIEHKPFPYPTLHRFHFFQGAWEIIKNNDQFIYVDIDSLFTDCVGEEVISPITVVQHCGYLYERGTYETRKESTSFVPEYKGQFYVGGGFWSFSNNAFKKLIFFCTQMIDEDIDNGIIPLWHDESVLNRYIIDNFPTKLLSPSYHYPQDHPHIMGKWKKWGVNFPCKILMLKKDLNHYQK